MARTGGRFKTWKSLTLESIAMKSGPARHWLRAETSLALDHTTDKVEPWGLAESRKLGFSIWVRHGPGPRVGRH